LLAWGVLSMIDHLPRGSRDGGVAAIAEGRESRHSVGQTIDTAVAHLSRSVGDEKGAFIDLDTGLLYFLPADIAEVGPMLAWARQIGADALYSPATGTRQFLGIDMVVVPVSDDRAWEEMALRSIADRIDPDERRLRFPVPMRWDRRSPATYMFMTREGGRGILQILGVDANDGGLAIRYRLSDAADAARH
jgi:hypothetical protein